MSAVPAPERRPIARPPANWFSIPNAVVDRLLACAEPAEVYCYLVILRETAGRNRAEADIPTETFQQRCKLSERGVLAALHELREVKRVITGRQGRFAMNYREQEWLLEERQPRKRVVKPKVEPEGAPEPLTGHCPACGHEGPAQCPECAHLGMLPVEEKAKDASECTYSLPDPASQHAPECMLEAPTPPVSNEVAPQVSPERQRLQGYLATRWAPIFLVAPTEEELAAIECKLGDAPLHCFEARCEHRRDFLSSGGRGYRHMALMAQDARSGFLLLRNSNVRPITGRPSAEAPALPKLNREEAAWWLARDDCDPDLRAEIEQQFPDLVERGAS